MLVRMLVTTVLAILGAACADDAVLDDPDVPEGLADPSVYSAPLCEISPDVTEGPCLLACDPDALVDQYVPEHTCITFNCPLADGTNVRLGGCKP